MREFVLKVYERPGGRGTDASLFDEVRFEAEDTEAAVQHAVALADSFPPEAYSATLLDAALGDAAYPLLHIDCAEEPEQ
jgi:hypothetical protein